ncbi:predicted protein [Postia placenta Mad-698-R]|nr:predicted protein [Postia placenta Mad-698-R]
MHASIAFKSALALIALARAVAGACDNSGQPIALCCTSFGPASDFAYVLENVCGVTVPDQSLDTGAGCESGVPCAGSEYQGDYSVCCAETISCQGNEDGVYGYNCTGSVVEG